MQSKQGSHESCEVAQESEGTSRKVFILGLGSTRLSRQLEPAVVLPALKCHLKTGISQCI